MGDQDGSDKVVIDRKQPCEVNFHVGDQVYQGTSMHFNERGMLVMTKNPAPLNTKGKIKLQFPGLKNVIELNGEVIWSNTYGPVDSFSPRGMGIRYVNLERDHERLIADIARQYESMGSIYSCYYS